MYNIAKSSKSKEHFGFLFWKNLVYLLSIILMSKEKMYIF